MLSPPNCYFPLDGQLSMAVIANWNKITKKNLPKVLTSFPLMDSSPLHVSQVATCPVHFKSKDSTLASRPSAYPRRCPAHYLSMLRANRSDLWIFLLLVFALLFRAVLFRPVGERLWAGQTHEFGGFLFCVRFLQSAV